MCVVVGWWLLSHVVVDVEIEIEKKRGKIEMGEEREKIGRASCRERVLRPV